MMFRMLRRTRSHEMDPGAIDINNTKYLVQDEKPTTTLGEQSVYMFKLPIPFQSTKSLAIVVVTRIAKDRIIN